MWWHNTSYTLFELMLGLFLGVLLRPYLATFFQNPIARKTALAFLVGSQSVPIVAIAPLIIIWFGPACFPKCLSAP